jgi:hypothetical protein
MGILRTKTIEPATGSTLTLGASGDTITVSSDSIKANTFKDAGGNTLFTSDGAGTLSSVNAGLAGGAGPILISTSTASGSSSIDITSGIDSTYDEYMFVFTDINPATDSTDFTFQANVAGQTGFNETVTSTAWRAYHYENDSITSLGYRDTDDQAQGTGFIKLAPVVGNGADESCAGILHLFSPSSTTYVKHFYATTQEYFASDASREFFAAGYFNVTGAVDEISFKMSSGNFDGTIQMYGIK